MSSLDVSLTGCTVADRINIGAAGHVAQWASNCGSFGTRMAPADGCVCPGVFAVQLKAATGTDSNLLDTHRGTHRSNVPGSNLVTARLVDIDMPPGDDEPHRAPAHLADSPTGSDEVGTWC